LHSAFAFRICIPHLHSKINSKLLNISRGTPRLLRRSSAGSDNSQIPNKTGVTTKKIIVVPCIVKYAIEYCGETNSLLRPNQLDGRDRHFDPSYIKDTKPERL
jgi:hypothetical protein